MPTRFEPCGLTTMYAVRYDALPVTRAVGGLADTVVDAGVVNPDDHVGSGFAFAKATLDDMEDGLMRATSWYRDSKAWKRLQRRAIVCFVAMFWMLFSPGEDDINHVKRRILDKDR